MKKRTMTLLLACVMMAAVFAGCSSQTAQSGSDAETIKLGGLAPLTGEVSMYGIATNNGIKIAIDEINAAGGVLGKQIDYVAYDEKGDATEAVNAYNKLVQSDKIVGLIGDVTSTPCLAVAQQAVKDNMPMITATGTAKDITAAGTNVFRACFIDPFQGELMAAYTKKLGYTKAAILYDTSSDYSVGLTDSFVAEAASQGIEIVAKEGYTAGDVDFKAQLTKIAASSPEVLFLPEYYEDVVLIAPQAREAGITAVLLGADGWDSVVESIDPSNISAIEGSYFCCHASMESTDPAFVAFRDKYTELYGERPNMFAALGYDAAKILCAAIEKAGTTDSDAVIEAMAATDYEGITGHVIYDEERNPIKSAAITSITDGNYKFVETFGK